MRRAGETTVLARTQQKGYEVGKSAYGEKDMLNHGKHPVGDNMRPHHQTEDKRGHSFWSTNAAGTVGVVGVVASAADQTAKAADAVAQFTEEQSVELHWLKIFWTPQIRWAKLLGA
jgi:hypothetical protein